MNTDINIAFKIASFFKVLIKGFLPLLNAMYKFAEYI
jgi:hypothetical protein